MPEMPNVLLVNRAVISENNRILLLQRSHDDRRNPMLWEFPGGKMDTGEELTVGLTREIKEETGFVIETTSPIIHVESEFIRTGKYANRLYVALFHVAHILEGSLALSEEHEDACWEEPEAVLSRDLTLESALAFRSFRSAGII